MTTTHGAQTPDQTAGGLPMTAAEFRIARESLGVSDQWLADHLGVSLRTMQRWGQGHSRLSLSVVERVEMLLDTTDGFVEAVVAELEADPDPDDLDEVPTTVIHDLDVDMPGPRTPSDDAPVSEAGSGDATAAADPLAGGLLSELISGVRGL